MNVLEYIERNKSISGMVMPTELEAHQVRAQASYHMVRLAQHPLFEEKRPNEAAEIKAYRDTNKRNITTGGVYKFLSKASRIFTDAGFTISKEGLSVALTEYISGKPYFYLGMNYGLFDFFYRAVLPKMAADPNALLVSLPVVPSEKGMYSPMLAPSENLPPTERVGIDTFFVSSGDVKAIDGDIVIYERGKHRFSEKHSPQPVYWLWDRMDVYRALPTASAKGKITYTYSLWYHHGTGRNPVSVLGGVLAESEKGYPYFESILRPYFELADEVIPAFSDNQAVRVSHAYPKMILAPTPCQDGCNGTGKIRMTDELTGENTFKPCTACGGSGHITNPGPMNVIVRALSDFSGGSGSSNVPVLEYVTPPADMVEYSYNVSFDLLQKANKAIGLDALIDMSESGTAKSYRLEDLKDFLSDVANLLFSLMQRHLYAVDALLNVSEASRSDSIRVEMPYSLDVKDLALLKDSASMALPLDRYGANLEYIRRKYRGDSEMLRVYELALIYAPSLMVPDSQFTSELGAGVWTNTDAKKRALAVPIFIQISREREILDLSEEQAFDLANDYFSDWTAIDMEFQPDGAQLN